MSPFYNHIKNQTLGKSLGDRIDEVVIFIDDFFQPQKADQFFIMDPYFNVFTALRDPFNNNRLEDTIWSSLITLMATEGSTFSIITNEQMSIGIPPSIVEFPKSEDKTVTIEACYYPNGTVYGDYTLHDRYILRKNDAMISGLHIGPSLTDIHNKDISITKYETGDARLALDNFIFLWEQCKLNKGWKKN